MMEFRNVVFGRIDFDCLCDTYFWDLDFLISAAEFDGLVPEAKATLGFANETFVVVVVVYRMPPHPDELQLKVCPNEPLELVVSEC